MNNSHIKLALVLGSGLSENVSKFPMLSVLSEKSAGINNKLIFISEIEGFEMLFFAGRKHFYEGFSYDELVSNMSLAASLGVKNVILTNASGGLHDNFEVGDLMLIDSHVNLNRSLKLERSNFPYSKELGKMILRAGNMTGVRIQRGIYCCSAGPAYETKAEIRMLKHLGCDAVGMSTIPEVSKANSLGLNAAAISVVTNLLDENSPEPPDHNDVVNAAKEASEHLFRLIKRLVLELN